jgi:hypothetical protein
MNRLSLTNDFHGFRFVISLKKKENKNFQIFNEKKRFNKSVKI